MSASPTVSGRSASKWRSSRVGATGRAWRVSGGPRGPPPAPPPPPAHPPRPPPTAPRPGPPPRAPPPAPRAGAPPPPRARRGGAPPRAVGPPPGGEDAADQAAQLGLRRGPGLDGRDRAQPGVEAGHARADDAAQRGDGVVRPLGGDEGEPAHWCTFGRAGVEPRRGVAFARPSTRRDGRVGSPPDGPRETRRTAGAGRPERTTG